MVHYTATSLRSFDGKSPVLGERVLIDPSAVVLGDVRLGDDVSVWPQVAIRGDVHSIAVGARSSVQDGTVLHVTHAGPYNPDGWPLQIGREVTVGHKAMLHGCTIGDNSLIGMGAIVLNGAVIGNNCLIGAGALVAENKVIPDNSQKEQMPLSGIKFAPKKTPTHNTLPFSILW